VAELSDLSRQGQDLAEYWFATRQRLRTAQAQVKEAARLCEEAGQKLGEFLMPVDMEPGEKICAWVRSRSEGEVLVQIEKKHGAVYVVDERGVR
jgi:hypothetical protein